MQAKGADSVQTQPFSVTSQPGHGGLRFRGSRFFFLAHPDYKNLRSRRNPSAPPNSTNSFCSGAAHRSSYLSLSLVRPASSCRDDLPRRPHAPFSVDEPASSPSSISPSNGLNAFVRASLAGPPPDAVALPLCPVCSIASGKSCFDCEQQFCPNHIYSCADCGNQYCGACLDAHHADGHWSDSDTAFELAASQRAGRSSSASELAAARGVVRASSVNAVSHHVPRSSSVDLRRSTLATSHHRQASRSAIPVKLKSLLSQHLTRVATLISFMFQNIALQSEAGS